MARTTFIYALCEPGTRTVRYIGMTGTPLKKRLQAHISGSVKFKSRLGDWLRLLRSAGERPEILKLCETSETGWREEETRYIQSARMLGFNLVNGNDGGGGQPFLSPEHRAAISAAQKGRRPTDACLAASRAIHLGSKKSPEHCAKLSASHTGVPWTKAQHDARLGKTMLPERRIALNAVLSAANKGVPWSEARRAAYEQTKKTK